MTNQIPNPGILFEIEGTASRGACLDSNFADGLHLRGKWGEILDLITGPFRVVAESKIPKLNASSDWSSLLEMSWYERPFRFALGTNALLEANEMLDWLTENDQWKRDNGGFYIADVISVEKLDGRPPCSRLFSAVGQAQLEKAASQLFDEEVRLHGPIAVHRMTPPQAIGIHSDMPEIGEETHRILIFLGNRWQLTQGGHFVLLAEQQPIAAKVIIPHTNNTVFAFQLAKTSYHAVTTIIAGQRFSVVMSFRKV